MTEQLYRPGLEGIIAGETAVSSIAGALRYRGYAIEQLAEHASFEEVSYLLLYGELPNRNELTDYGRRIGEQAAVAGELIGFLKKLPSTAGMMDVMRTGASALAHWDAEAGDNSHDANLRKAERLIAQLPVVMAARHRVLSGKEPVPADPKRSLAENLLYMLRRRDPSPRAVRALDMSLVLYAEHEYNASTFTSRVVASTLSDMHSAVTAAIGALKGPLHGGANERVMEVLAEVGTPENAEKWVRDALAAKKKVMGFGHRVYKKGDPRAAYLKNLCRELAEETGNQAMEEMADTIERVVTSEKGLPPNLDWPSARLYHYLDLPVELYTPLFVVSRVAGWAAHVIEQLDNNRIIRPLARYTGAEPREWAPLESR